MSNEKQDTRTDDSTYDGQYGLVNVTEWPCGTQIQVDSTPGKERMFIRQASGSYTEISSDGKVINFNVGDAKVYNKAGFSFTVDENGDFKIGGHGVIRVGGGAHIEVAGDAGIFAGGDVAVASMGAANIRAKSAYLGTDGDLNMNVGGTMNVKSGGDINMNSGGNINLNS